MNLSRQIHKKHFYTVAIRTRELYNLTEEQVTWKFNDMKQIYGVCAKKIWQKKSGKFQCV